MEKIQNRRDWIILAAIWLVGILGDRLWFALDNSVPSWDVADYLTGSLNYWQAFQDPHWFSGEWWRDLWLLSSKIPPFTYMVTAFCYQLVGRGTDNATLVYIFFSAILMVSVYGLGRQLFSRQVGLLAAGMCWLFPGLYQVRLNFLLDYPVTAVVAGCFFILTTWKFSQNRRNSWWLALALGISVGIAFMVKQTTLLFLLIPLLWVALNQLRRRHWERFLQLIVAAIASVGVWGWWYRTNWLLVLTSSKRATVDAAAAESDPPLNSLAAWTYYWQDLPNIVSWVLLLVPIVGLLLYGWRQKPNASSKPQRDSWIWVAVFLLGAYFLNTLNVNKDPRYVLPYLPVLSLVLAYGFTCWRQIWVPYSAIAISLLLTIGNTFPIVTGGFPLSSDRVQHFPYLGPPYPHQEVIREITTTIPHLQTTVGVLPSTPSVNQHNINYYGALADFQVYGRQVGVKENQVVQDMQALDWFVTKTGNQGSVPPPQATITQLVRENPEFQQQNSWKLPDGSQLQLYRRQSLPISIKPASPASGSRLQLQQVTVPQRVPPNYPIPVTYEWLGSAQDLQEGLVLLTWRRDDESYWLHDRALGNGRWHDLAVACSPLPGSPVSRDGGCWFQVTEKTAMLPSPNASGEYTLEATYLNRRTGETYPLAVDGGVSVTVDRKAEPVTAPAPDLVSQLRVLASRLPQGMAALDAIFTEIARMNQYDPKQDYTVHARETLQYRLEQNPNRVDWAYAVAFTYVLQRKATEAIDAFQRVVQLDGNNPYARAYLAFVYLYDWQPHAAEQALQPALTQAPNMPELKVLRGVAALMQGNFWQAWQDARALEDLS
jgi:4-amino-4-deoxy-L-arabinose transferase-like glycosyltransferase